MAKERLIGLVGLFAGMVLAALPVRLALAQQEPPQVEVIFEDHHDFSRPLRDIAPKGGPVQLPHEIPLRIPHPGAGALQQTDPVVQRSATTAISTTGTFSFLGVGNGFTGPNGTFTVDAAPPDTNGAAGDTQFVQWVNESFAVFDKVTGQALLGPVPGNTLWSGFGGGCETNNDGDPIVQYDKANHRWIMTQFSVSTTPYLQCFAVSQTSDATGAWNRYAMQMPTFPDYPKLGVWPDAYYITFNMFSGNFFVGARACALDGAAMRAGAAATAQCFQLSSSFASLLPSDVDGATPPPAGSPNYLLNVGTNSLRLWKFHVDWANAGNTSLTGPISLAVGAFTQACGGGTCIPQRGTKEKLDSLGDRLMYRLAYRNFVDATTGAELYESLVVNHSVAAGRTTTSNSGIRWYELRNPGTAPTVYQQGTYAPDSSYRWMGSIAMDKVGNIAVGYSVSSATLNPAIRYTGRAPSDPQGTLQAEASIIEGTGSQIKPLSRWGDYSSMSIDPIDDCTFWYTNEYLQSYGRWNWSTQIASFKFPSCQ